MQSIVDASTALSKATGTKRAASPALSCQSSSQHDSPCDYACSCKRQRTSSIKIPGRSLVSARTPKATSNMMTKTAIPFNNTQDCNPSIGLAASALNDRLKNSILSATYKVTQQRAPSH